MATSGTSQHGIYAPRSGLPTFGNFGNALLERGNPGIRKSTPDSEALASSDEEADQSRLRSAAHRKVLQNRRPSLLADLPSDPPRRLSFAGNSHSPATGSQPNTPGIQHDTWPSISPSISAWNTGSAYPFGTNIWGASSRDPPARLQEMRQDTGEGRIPFSIPSQPNLSAQRSMSFSVGQTEYDNTAANTMEASSRAGQGLTRRTSRPGNLGYEYSIGLSRVNENEDTGLDISDPQQTAQTSRGQNRAMSSTAIHPASAAFRNARLRNSILDPSETAIDDVDEPTAQLRHPVRNQLPRRMSDFQAAIPTRQPNGPPFSNTSFGTARNTPHWSSNLDFGQLDTIPQSRRHSFADVPTRRGSMGSNEEDDEHSASYDAGSQGLSQEHELSYFGRNENLRRQTEQEVQQLLHQEHHQAIFGPVSPYGITSNASSIGVFHGPNPAPLYVVNFKCCRSDIFYIQEGTGLSLKDGDLVIVEADRGTDLGCVQHSHVSWEAARKYKAKYAEQHFAWLMMFSQQTRIGGPNAFNPNAVATGRNGAGPQGTALRDSDLKPKMIKRLAQTHEIQALQEKEGNEARAKRVCQQKVAEHGLNMEILDAEFQMDGKKLTFYFFSNEYINFNALVTDLFKMYKTRIWMSAINPASFQSPVSSLGITPLYNNAGLGVTNAQTPINMYDDSRSEQQYIQQAQQLTPSRGLPALYYGGYGQAPQINDYAAFSPTLQQTTNDPFANYGMPPGYGMPGSRTHTMPMSRQDVNARNLQASTSANTLANHFGSLSLAR